MQAVRLLSTAELSEAEWLAARRRGIGGSDIAAIAGLHPYVSPVEVFFDKTGQAPEREETAAMHFGKRLEAVIAEEYADRHPDVRVQRVNAVLQHPEEPIFLANIDRLVRDKQNGDAVLEIKCSSAYRRDEWTDTIPDWVICQVQWYLGVTGLRRGVVAALIGGNQYFEHEVQRDDELIQSLQQIGRDFWRKHVETGIPPAFDGSEASTELLARLYPEGRPEEIALPADAAALIQEYEEADRYAKEWLARKEAAANRLKAMLGEYEVGWVGDRRVEWKTIERAGYSVPPSKYRKFSVK